MTQEPAVFNPRSELEFHSPTDYLYHSTRRKTVIIIALVALIIFLLVVVVHLVGLERPAYVVAITPDGNEYVISTPKKRIDLRDLIIINQVKQDLRQWAEAFYQRDPATAQKDYETARWFLPDQLLSNWDAAARGDKGWIAGLTRGEVQAARIHVVNIVMRDADLQTPPFRATIIFDKQLQGRVEHWRSEVTFIVDPALAKPPFPLYNALGIFILRQPEDSQDYSR